ncbi:MAG: phosphoenolpyruvate--protein phosphotransferase, partial [Planctomycetia bacterium]
MTSTARRLPEPISPALPLAAAPAAAYAGRPDDRAVSPLDAVVERSLEQVSAAPAGTQPLVEPVAETTPSGQTPTTGSAGGMRRGVAVSPGVVVAQVLCLDTLGLTETTAAKAPADLPLEVARFNQACEEAAVQLGELADAVSQELGRREAAIFRAQYQMLCDRSFLTQVHALILDRGFDAPSALRAVLAEYETVFSQIADDYIRERVVDLRDVVARVLRRLDQADQDGDLLPVNGPVVLVAEELFPSQTVRLGRLRIAGIVTERGGATSHAAVIARSLGIPAVSGVVDLLKKVRTGDLIAVDGREGLVLLDPGPEAVSAYRKLEREFFDFKDCLVENRDEAAVTTDGVFVDLYANVNNLADVEAARDIGAFGIGLYRTEYLFLTHPTIPDEDEQCEVYRAMVEASPNRSITIRTLDLGGDKTVPYFGQHGAAHEPNPFLGWRSIRMIVEHPDFFLRQMRAILRASVAGQVRLLLPMLTTLDELRRVRRLLLRARRELTDAGTPWKNVGVGVMIEVPAAALCIDHFLDHVDFISIGTNDLVQYLTAADRDNPRVAHLCEPLSPPVLRLLWAVV